MLDIPTLPPLPQEEKKHNHLLTAEMSMEGNYNMLDGIINNIEKPSMLARLAYFEQKKRERHKSDIADKRRKRKKSSREK